MEGIGEQILHWYAFKVFFNKVYEIETEFKARDIECYIPAIGVSSLLFFKATDRIAREMQHVLDGRVILYTRLNKEGEKVPARIPDEEMRVFILVTSSGEPGIEYISYEAGLKALAKGERVRVIGGVFKGAEGYIKRIKGDNKLVVAITGLCAVATSYIPRKFLERLEPQSAES